LRNFIESCAIIANDDVLSSTDAITAIKNLNLARDRMSIWLVTGKDDAAISDRIWIL